MPRLIPRNSGIRLSPSISSDHNYISTNVSNHEKIVIACKDLELDGSWR